MNVCFYVLGSVGVRVNGREVSISGRRQLVALATLLLTPNRAVPHTTFIEAVWGDDPPATARNQLATAVWKLRRTLVGAGLCRDIIKSTPQGYRISAPSEQIDHCVAMDHVNKARTAAARHDTEAAIHQFCTALAVWQGSPLQHIRGTALDRKSIRLEEFRMTVVEELLELQISHGDERDAIIELSALVRQHPLRENLRRLLMLALDRAGRKAEALQIYSDGRKFMIDALGLEPSGALQDAHARILAGPVLPNERRRRSHGRLAGRPATKIR